MADMMVKEGPKTVMASNDSHRSRRQSKIEQEEKELEELLANGPDEQQDQGTAEREDSDSNDAVDDSDTEEEGGSSEENQELTGEEKTFKKRYSDLRRHLTKKQKEWEEEKKQLEERMKTLEENSSPVDDLPEEDSEVDAWLKKYPDVANVIQKVADKIATQKFEAAEERMKKFDKVTEEQEIATAEKKIRKAHDDYDEIKESDDFHSWVEDQGGFIESTVYDKIDPDGMIKVINYYKAEKGLKKKPKKKDLGAAENVSARNSRKEIDESQTTQKIKESDVNKMSMEEFEKNWDKIQEAQRTGNFIYDVSGAAR